MPRQTRVELLQHLNEQRSFLRRSADFFDQGIEAEAKRLAAVIRILVHDTSRSRSLLRQLGVKEKLRYHDSRVRLPVPGAIVVHAGLAGIEMSFGPEGTTKFYPPLGELSPERQGPPIEFPQWWNGEVIRDNHRVPFTRRELVLGVANLDGGAHVDPELRKAYAAITRGNSHGWQLFSVSGKDVTGSPVLANVRQIAWELESALDEQLPELLGDD